MLLTDVASSTFNIKTSLLFYDNYFKSPVFNDRENNCNTNTTKSILRQFVPFYSCLILTCSPFYHRYVQ